MWPSELHFLDLTDTDEDERNFLHATLFTRNPSLRYPELPWVAHPNPVCTPAEWRPAPYGEPAEVPPVPVTLDGGDCNSSVLQNTSSPAGQEVVSQEPHSVAGTGVHTTTSVYPADTTVMSVPPQIPTSVPAPAQPSVMTTMYHIPGVPLPNVYVGNVTANVHGYVSNPYGHYQHISPQQMYTGDVSHEPAPPNVRNGGRDSRRGRSKPSGKRMDGQFPERNSGSRHNQEVITQPPPLVDSPPTGNTNMPQQNFPIFPISPMHHPYSPGFYNTTPSHHAHLSAQHATGTPIYLPNHTTMYAPPPTLYTPYHPPHQPGAPPIMPFPAPIQSGPVPTTENSVLGTYPVENSGAEERISVPTSIVSNKELEFGDIKMHHQKEPSPQPAVYQSEPVQEACQASSEVVVDNGQKSVANPTSYQQQQSEEDDFSQTNLVNTVVVNNSNIISEPVSFPDTTQTGVEINNSNLTSPSGHQKFSNDVSSKFVPEKNPISSEDLVDENILLHKDIRVNVSDTNSGVNTVVCEVDSKREKTVVDPVTLPSGMAQHEKSYVDVKSALPRVDVPTSGVNTPKPSLGPSADVAPFANNSQPVNNSVSVQHQTSGQSVASVTSASHPIEVSNTHVATPPASSTKLWSSLFEKTPDPNSPGEPGMIVTGAPVSAAPGGSKPVKPFQNAIPVSSDPSRRFSEGPLAQPAPSVTGPANSTSRVTPSGIKNFLHEQPRDSNEDPLLYRLGEFLIKYQLEHKALSLQPRGLTNRSNWCYINSILQALLACPPFYNLMKALSAQLSVRRSTKSTTPIIDSMVQFVSEFSIMSAATRPRDRKEKAVRKDDGSIEDQCGPPFEPNYIYKMLNSIKSDTFKVEGRQEDAEEFLGCLLNALNDEMLELIRLVEEPATKSTLSNGDIATNGDTSAQSQDEDETEWKVMGPKNKGSITRRADFGRTPISDIFRGQLRSRVQRAGDQSTDNVQPFFTLQLDIEKAQSVKDALEILVGRDQLEGVTCSRTNQEVEAWQQVSLEELPLVLLLHLKWFDYKMDGASKIVKNVEFPIDLKVDQKLLSSTKKYAPKQRQYKLFAVVYHDGKEATKGHYVTDVYHVGYGGWVRYDDSVVKAVQEINVLRPKGPRVPYLLYYRRSDTIGYTQPPSASDKTR